MIKHFFWNSNNGDSGRLAVRADSDRFVVKRPVGNAPPAEIIWLLIHEMGEDFQKAANELNQSRKHRCAVEVRVGMSGCVDYLLREERYAELHDYPIAARLHVSMYGKLNSGVDMWPGDIIPLLMCRGRIAYPEADSIHVIDAEIGSYEFEEQTAFLTVTAEGYDISADTNHYLSEKTLERLRDLSESFERD